MAIKENIGLIGGGQMGEALLKGLLGSDLVTSEQLMVVDPSEERRECLARDYAVRTSDSPQKLADHSDVIILAVKPQVMAKVLSQYSSLLSDKHLLVSIAAGVSLSSIEGIVGEMRILRVMPNTPALVMAAASVLSGNSFASQDDLELGLKIFSAVGTCLVLPESLMDGVTGLSGSGPGYVFTFIEAMVDGGVLAGLPRPVAEKLVLQTIYGSAKLALETGKGAAELKAMVTSPGGTTITGIAELEKGGLRASVMSAVAKATIKSAELGKCK